MKKYKVIVKMEIFKTVELEVEANKQEDAYWQAINESMTYLTEDEELTTIGIIDLKVLDNEELDSYFGYEFKQIHKAEEIQKNKKGE